MLINQSGLRLTMFFNYWCFVLIVLELLCVTTQQAGERRHCAFQEASRKTRFRVAGNVNGSVHVCNNTRCCVGYYLMVEGQPRVDVLACDSVEKSCPDAVCKAQPCLNNKMVKCVCNTDMCNRNLTWSETPHEPQPSSRSVGKTWVVIVAIVPVVCLAIAAVQWRRVSQHKKNSQASLHVSPSPHQTMQLDVTDVQLQEMVAQGSFATVWRGTYQGSTVAVKVIPATSKQAFATEKDVYELPLMRHAAIIHFLGAGRRSCDGSWLLVLQMAEYGSLHSFLNANASSWQLSLKLCLSLSQGLSYLHLDLHTQDGHKPSVAHGDLSSFNVLVRGDCTCALCDFGSATILCSRQRQAEEAKSPALTARTPCYMSPEILEGFVDLSGSWCLHGDVYALGLLLWEICMRCSDLFEDGMVPQHFLPYDRELEGHLTWENLIVHVSHMKKRPSIPVPWHLLRQGPALEDLLRECWDMDPDARLTAQCVVDRLVALHSLLA
ncbi:anti-Muellerian hormone type-2 receptor-like isoform X1 [Corythoichthys intestinalis]|uniref:anti-Muellerian hormone type-2 receptor-like isoform X1 n=1 Tax=Corythoichthys intestinalis TaxID=161448 RepID=UPI0025A5EC04|nr:anti-Muellerian hormone type-2 receptor-like isoform X1 [Corythoichthys intestinalis]